MGLTQFAQAPVTPLVPMISIATACLLALALPPQTGAPAAPMGVLPQGHAHTVLDLVRIEGNERSLLRLQRLDLDIVERHLDAGWIKAIVDDIDIAAIEGLGLDVVREIEDLAAHYARRLAVPAAVSSTTSLAGQQSRVAGAPYGQSLVPAFGQGSMGGYYTFDEIVSVIDQLRSSYPSLVSPKVSIGQTEEGRDVWMFKVSDNPTVDEAEPELRIDSMHHAREPQSMQTTIYFVSYLLEAYGIDPIATYLVDEREIYVIPCVNPDGYEFNRSQAPGGGGLWRKNRRDNGDGSFGVDLNRNYSYEWDGPGSVTTPSATVYRGPFAGSEPESSAMMQLMGTRSFTTALSVHSYGNLWLSPWFFTEDLPPDWSDLLEIAKPALGELYLRHGPAGIMLYLATGTTIDYDYATHDTYSWTPEIGSSDDGFWPPQNRILPLAEENRLAFAGTALGAGTWLRPLDLTTVDFGNNNGVVENGEAIGVFVSLHNSGRVDSGTTTMVLSSPSPAVAVTVASATTSLESFADGINASPLEFIVAEGTPLGTVIPIAVTITESSRSFEVPGTVVVGQRIVASFDFQANGDEGWAVGTPNDASMGHWERTFPRGTSAQPTGGNIGSPGTFCWFTGQGLLFDTDPASNDVDGGQTTLMSPTFDLHEAISAKLRFVHWYSNDVGTDPNADVFQVDVSADGGSTWTGAVTFGPSGPLTSGGWFESEFDLGSLVALTDSVRVRFIASDLGPDSIVEAAIDDVAVLAIVAPACFPPRSYCTVSPNGASFGSIVFATGSQDVADQDLSLSVVQAIPSSFGLFFYGPDRDDVLLGNGHICVGGDLTRLPIVQTDSAGAATFPVDFNALPTTITNGETTRFQFWHRDTIGAGFNFSNGIEITFCSAP